METRVSKSFYAVILTNENIDELLKRDVSSHLKNPKASSL